MAKKFTQLPAANDPDGNEIIAVVQSGTSKRMTISQMLGENGGLKWGGFISGAPDLPLEADTQFIASADFSWSGFDIVKFSIITGPAGANAVTDFSIR